MTLHRLAVRTKKSLSGLYSSQKDSSSASFSPRATTAKLTVTPPKTASSTIDEYGISRSCDDTSPRRDSPSRRQRLLGSLRSMKSLRSLRSSHSSPKKSAEEPSGTETPQTPVRETPSVSLNFEASPADVPMFGPMTRTTSGSSSLRVHHSSPITVPIASRETTPMARCTPIGLEAFPIGTVPDSPAPLQMASVQEAITSNAAKESPHKTTSEIDFGVDLLPTPMPGTNLPLEDVTAPGIMVTSPSAPSMQEQDLPGYFDSVLVQAKNDYERTKTLDTESGFPILSEAHGGALEANDAELDDQVLPEHDTVPEVEPASFDESFPVAPKDGHVALSAPRTPSGSNDYGENLAYVVYDSLDVSEVGRKRCPGRGHLTGNCCDHTLYDSTAQSHREATSSSHDWTDSTEAATTDGTELTQHNSPAGTATEAAAEAKLVAAIEQLDAATLLTKPKTPVDDEKALQDIIRAYAHLREGTDDVSGGIPRAEGLQGITQELKEEVETSIRVMNTSLGG